MNRKHLFVVALAIGMLVIPGPAAAHTPLFSCMDNGDGTIFCEGGFSDGSTAAGVPILVKDSNGAILLSEDLSRNSDIEFDKPDGDYVVIFDSGEGHTIEIAGSQIFE